MVSCAASANNRTEPRTQRMGTTSGHCQNANGALDTAGHVVLWAATSHADPREQAVDSLSTTNSPDSADTGHDEQPPDT
eukprot:12547208-Alexandrium_andersonii.AAC.1